MPPTVRRFVTTTQQLMGSGIYRCYTCEDSEVILREGDEVPECGKCNRPVTWELRRPLGA